MENRAPPEHTASASPGPTTAGAIQLDADLVKWTDVRVGEYVASKILRTGKFYRRWNIRQILYDITQRMDYSVQTCLYLAVSSGRVGAGASQRAHSDVGFNRNPIESVRLKNARHGPNPPPTRAVWTLLAYAVFGKRQFPAEVTTQLLSRITALKGHEAKVLEILKFAMRNGLIVRIDASVFQRGSRWFMPEVQKHMSTHKQFIEYARALESQEEAETPAAEVSTPRPPLHSEQTQPQNTPGLVACLASQQVERGRPRTPELRPVPQSLRCSG